jgi:hypothetical protein
MTYGPFLSTVAVAGLLVGVALLVVLSALTLAPLNSFRRSHTGVFVACLVGIWVGAALIIFLIKAQDMTP